MTGPAIALLVVAVILVWGGLIASVLFIRARPEVDPASLPPLPPEADEADETRAAQPHPTRDT
ncbi:MetS family NSS transporter small subunit [Gordonia caeni]|uniref:Methionine/alanine import family NSS transporter small subunit n=1 Tax=Gordonia caeni TaxID=1007097 RepID=A0ABP7NSL3_9ACTN